MPEKLRNILKKWYIENGRSLPWRNELTPYHIWLSEIILQQTQVKQGLPYYYKFVSYFPDIKSLSNAEEREILNLWQGLGYYSRARNMHQTANVIVNKYRSSFPDDYKSLISLKGIGDYTASAILSIAFNKPYAVVDGNVYRVLSRIAGIETPIDTTTGKKEFRLLADQLLDKKEPGNFNQAMMDFGAIQCKKVPDCSTCLLLNYCNAYLNNTVSKFPVKSKKTKVLNRYIHYLILQNNKELVLTKRTSNDIWKNLYDFPQIETSGPNLIYNKNISEIFEPVNKVEAIKCIYQSKHKLSHRNIIAKFYTVSLEKPLKRLNFEREYLFVNQDRINDFPFPKPIENFLNFFLIKK